VCAVGVCVEVSQFACIALVDLIVVLMLFLWFGVSQKAARIKVKVHFKIDQIKSYENS